MRYTIPSSKTVPLVERVNNSNDTFFEDHLGDLPYFDLRGIFDIYPTKRGLEMMERGLRREETAADLRDQASSHAMKAGLYATIGNNPMARYHTEVARELRQEADALV